MGPLPHLLAKSEPAEELTDHLTGGLSAATALSQRVGDIAVLRPVFSASFWTAVKLGILCHDLGKAAAGFQDMIWGRAKSWGERHEVVSLGFLAALVPDAELRDWIAVAVATHHRPLHGDGKGSLALLHQEDPAAEFVRRLGPVPTDDVRALIRWTAETAAAAGLPVASPEHTPDVLAEAHELLHHLLSSWRDPLYDDEKGLGAVILQGAVTLADHLSSAHGSLRTVQPLGTGFPALLAAEFEAKGRTLREHQTGAGTTHGHLLLRAPTGSGKTEAGLLWASTQVTDIAEAVGGIPRVFYTLPYLASINAMADRLGTLLGDPEHVGVAHSRAASYHLARAIGPEDAEGNHAEIATKAVSRANATRLFRETVRVGTPYQLMRGALAGAAHSSVLIDAANSVFVLDELHAYDPTRLGYILATASLWDRLGGRIAVLSATLPDALAEQFRAALSGTVHEPETPDLGLPRRHRLRTRPHHLTDDAAIGEIASRLRDGEAVLVVANNVRDAQTLFEELSPLVPGNEAVLLHARFRRDDRNRIEDRIRARHGVGRPRTRGLVVATQVVEVSLDVDFDCLYTSAAPLEALLQRFGRVNRVAALPPADVVVHAAEFRTRSRGPELYADGVYEQDPVELAWQILNAHDGIEVDEIRATEWLNDIYASTWGERWKADVAAAREAFTDAFLTFDMPFDGREHLTERFDEMFDGTEAILLDDVDRYRTALTSAPGAGGRLLAENFLIPMPHWARPLTRLDKELKVRVMDGVYDARLGLTEVRGPDRVLYRKGEII
ncbi:CRISPR-associated helicase/endonuclease Cas3 [Actinomadura atramentaria]|uniref:CRISPR-associated helicase/endonuclease Cas3 n=1 Tax=Actinomadura atramentaria TaxID=1990 RepID=UPI00036B434B|nr:CRISPR-associated helicase/endonuclease Cas3 [Actinomadura atramentaria]